MSIKLRNINLASAHILSLVFLCLISIWGALVYFFYALNNIGVIIALILAIVSFIIILLSNARSKEHVSHDIYSIIQKQEHKISNKKRGIYFSLLISYFLLIFSCFYILLTHQTTEAIISPWQAAPKYFFAFYGLATAILTAIILKHKNTPYTFSPIPLISLHYFLSFSIALMIYKIGFGFDPFVHQATVELIDKTGAVFPKPFYYLGQYSLEIIIHKITNLPLIWIDRLLVPLFAALYLPPAIYQALKKLFPLNKIALLVSLLILTLPFSFLIATTPQNFAYFLLLLVILLGLKCSNIFDLILIYIFSLTAVSFQPIAGIPALLFSLALTVFHSDQSKKIYPSPSASLSVSAKKIYLLPLLPAIKLWGVWRRCGIKKYFYTAIFIISSLILPLVFYFFEKNNYGAESVSAGGALPDVQQIFIPGQENFILNFIYLYAFNLKFIIMGLTAIGLWFTWKHREYCKIFFIYLLLSASLGLSYLFSKFLPFSFLISYERNNYSERILLMATFFLLPLILTAIYALFVKINKQTRGVKIPLTIFSVIILTASLYIFYPRFDHYYNSRGYSTGKNDIDAVRWIEESANEDYIALANQQISTAALREFGFKKYYKDTIFYYPIPTGGPLYQYYLDMVYKKPSRVTMNAAMDLVGVKKGYFVLNKYWWAFPKILEEAKIEADSWKDFGSGEVYVFEYKR